MIDKPERYDPYRLPGRVEFLYDGKPVSTQETMRGIVDDEKGRILVRDRQRERELAASLAPRGIRPMEGWQAEKYSIWIPSQKLPEAVEALVAEGWIVEAQGYFVRRAGTWRMNVTSGVDWFDLAGTFDFDGMQVHLPEILEALRHGQNYVRLKDGSRGLLPQDWLEALRLDGRTGRGGRRGHPLSLVAGAALGRLAGGPGAGHRRRPFRTAPREPALVQRRRPDRRAGGIHRRVAALSEDRPGLAALPAGLPPRRLPGRRHGPGQDRPGAGHAARAAHAAGQTARAAVHRRWPWCPRASCSTGSRRPSGSRPNCGCWTTPACSAAP